MSKEIQNPKKRNSMPSREQILDAWYFGKETEYPKEEIDRLRSIVDYIPPNSDECWICRSKYTLARCHITAKCAGGSFDPMNFVILCRKHHKKSPDTNDPAILLTWIKTERPIAHDERFREWVEELKERKKWFPNAGKPNWAKGMDTELNQAFPLTKEWFIPMTTKQISELLFDGELENRLRDIERSKEFKDYFKESACVEWKASTYYSLLSQFEKSCDIRKLTYPDEPIDIEKGIANIKKAIANIVEPPVELRNLLTKLEKIKETGNYLPVLELEKWDLA